ncbi:DNA internalization-related competence protein ComEC/Rec2 [Rheinheimera gaetbuli]
MPGYIRWFYLGVLAYLLSLSWQYQHYLNAQQALLSSDMMISGVVIGTPRNSAEYSQFELKLDYGKAKGYTVALGWHYNIGQNVGTDYTRPIPEIQNGQRWRFSTKLRPVAGTANPGGINREAQALLNGIVAQGSVVAQSTPALLQFSASFRHYLLSLVERQLQGLATADILRALTVGEKHFSAGQWLGLQNSGLAHLLAISGLHIGLVFGWSLLLLRTLPWPVRGLPLRSVATLTSAFLVAWAYAWLAGFAIPTIRALAALFIVAITMLLKRRLNYSQYWLILCASLLLLQPFYLLSKSFWLSVLAVAAIFLLLWLSPVSAGNWRQKFGLFLRFHLLLTLAMTLLSIMLFNGSATVALLSNILFVPWCSLLALPLLLVTLVLSLLAVPGAQYLWQLADLTFLPLQWWLSVCAQSNSWLALPDWPVWLAVVSILLLLLWLLSRQQWLYPVLTMLLVSLILSVLRPAQWQLHVIDVGQGLAVLLQKGGRGLLYDAGPRYGDHSATAAVVLPYLRQRGIRQLDYLILSHDDSDHTGDWPLLQARYPTVQIISDISHIEQAKPCHALPSEYLGAQLTMLQPNIAFSSKNDASCVLLLNVHGWKILLPGDIGRMVEKQLLVQYPQLRAHVLLLAHHGSNSSSDFVFLHQLAPQLALNSASLYNRHQHPVSDVRMRLQLLGIALLNTAQSGAISLHIADETLHFQAYRDNRLPFWLQKPVVNAETLVTTR